MDFDVESAQRGVVFVRGMERPETQEFLFGIWQENVSNPLGGLKLAVGGLLFVCGAMFVGLGEAVDQVGRHHEQAITVESLRAVGARPEWAAALAAIARVAPLDEESLGRIVGWVDFRRV
jgi:hypothetical protein